MNGGTDLLVCNVNGGQSYRGCTVIRGAELWGSAM